MARIEILVDQYPALGQSVDAGWLVRQDPLPKPSGTA
jgi:hypothetical protein